ncbi:MAG: flagellar hook-associated protein FlgL [bacterium]|jgi:flagellar hook-associated protein 3|nr:flagellar hook-associated protein FlgL [bacterium]
MVNRVTENLINNTILFNIQNNIGRMASLQDKLATGRRINSPSDNPVNYVASLGLRYNIVQGRSYLRNIDGIQTQLEMTENSLSSLTTTLQDIRTLTVKGLNDVDPAARQAIAIQVRELYQQVIDIANYNYNGRYIFGGSHSASKSFVLQNDAILYKGDDFQQKIMIERGSTITSNLNGMQTFLHTPNQITSSIQVTDPSAPLAQQLRTINPNFPNLPQLPDQLAGAVVEGSPNPANSPTPVPNNYATFMIYNTQVKVDLAVDSLKDVVNRINATVADVTASINDKNQLVITSKRSDALVLKDGSRNIGFEPDVPQQANLLGALGMYRVVHSDRSLSQGYAATDPLVDGSVSPTPARSTVELTNRTFLFVGSNTGPANQVAVPFGDNMALTDVDKDGNEKLTSTGDPVFLDKLEALRITIDEEVIDLDLRSLTQGWDENGISGDADDIPGSTLEDLYELINNHPQLKGKVTAYTNKDGYGIEISATQSTDVFKVENVRKLFGRDLTMDVSIDALGEATVARQEPITRDTKLDTLAGALVDDIPNGGSLGIRRPDPLPAGLESSVNEGLIIVRNGDVTKSVDLRDVETIGEVMDRINLAGAGVLVKINEWGTGLEIESTLPGDGELGIFDMADGTIAKDLGFFGSPPPARILSDGTIPLVSTDVVGVGPLAAVMGDGQFEIEIRDANGAIMDTYSIEVQVGDTMESIVKRIDAADGKSGPGGGLFSAQIDGGVLRISSNYDNHSLRIDAAKDTTVGQFTTVIGIDQYTYISETNALTYGDAVSHQNTASILGVNNQGIVNEIEEKNIFRTLQNLERALRGDDVESLKQSLDDIDLDLNVILSGRTQLGARINRVDSVKSRLESAEDFSRQQLSSVEDADLAELITDMTMAENAYNAALAASAKVLQQSLINFLS